ncbi:molybdenum cofactor guanylyltransferase [Aquimarina sp. MMG015]|uniref:molybdenum cofactor guanylyltransferase n=1 Tax=unclassified Aquimarina TaxID=2627091 RepID=UPI000E4C9436|nr:MULTISPECIES: molybdenum cofactor guanylyltransferase [unclassified Aquimarina]AXT55892.1 molybdenum cofactor guanylyltransferase [Aquimarina sp. AD1]MBQ4805333.1 molybdenum cofactor guanylyltransferase [Aquimarina sp. MMG015]
MSSLKGLDITGIILAGGKSSRMGEDKGLKLHKGKPFIAHILKALESITDKILIITNNPAYTIFGYPCISDIIPDLGPVGGIYTGLTHTRTKQNLVLSCDVPFVNHMVLDKLISAYEPNFDIITFQDIPLITLYNESVINTFLESINKKRLSLRKTLSTLKVKSIPIEDTIAPYVKNINTQQQYKQATQWN